MINPLACRNWEYLDLVSEAGLSFIELPFEPDREKWPEIESKLSEYSIEVSSATVGIDLTSDEGIAGLDETFSLLSSAGVEVVFTSVRAGEADRSEVYRRLREVGDMAQAAGIKVGLETHPDLVVNGEVGRATMEAVDHPHIGINFDTANVHYYNRGVSSPEELKKVLPYVVSVHLKDTDGGYESSNFPALGQGVVDFPAVFSLLMEADFAGPFTLEIEGGEVAGAEPSERKEAYARVLNDSIQYLQGLEAAGKLY